MIASTFLSSWVAEAVILPKKAHSRWDHWVTCSPRLWMGERFENLSAAPHLSVFTAFLPVWGVCSNRR